MSVDMEMLVVLGSVVREMRSHIDSEAEQKRILFASLSHASWEAQGWWSTNASLSIRPSPHTARCASTAQNRRLCLFSVMRDSYIVLGGHVDFGRCRRPHP